MISEEVTKKMREMSDQIKASESGWGPIQACVTCRHFAWNLNLDKKGIVCTTFYCRLSGESVRRLNICDNFQEKDYLSKIASEKENEYWEQYIRPLEYVGLVNRVLESKIPNQMVLYAAKKIHGKKVEIQIKMDNYETHTITFLMDDPKPQETGDRIWMQTTIPSSAKCGDSYSGLLADSIKNALSEFEEFCKKRDNIMKEEEITLLEIEACSRLPYGFKATDGNTVYDVLLKQETASSVSIEGLLASEGKIKPILYPLSSITEEIFVNGSEICPMKYLAEAFDFDGYMGLYTTWNFDEERERVEFFAWGCKVCEMSLQSFFITPEEGKHNSTQLGLRHFQQVFHVLHQCHIDYRNLIAQGLAVSALVLDNSPYK